MLLTHVGTLLHGTLISNTRDDECLCRLVSCVVRCVHIEVHIRTFIQSQHTVVLCQVTVGEHCTRSNSHLSTDTSVMMAQRHTLQEE